MGSLDENRSVWTQNWDWSSGGDEWSSWWGGTDAMWHAAVLPRIHAFLPAGTILEIGPGYGRWTQYLRQSCDRLVLVDLAENCMDACRNRFAGQSNIEYHVNDGRSLAMVADESVDFAFSFDSLVHADFDVLAGYISQLARKLTPHGIAVIHHSNAGSYRASTSLAKWIPNRWAGGLMRRGVLIDLMAWRSSSVSAADVRSTCDRAALSCVAQERMSWEFGYYLTDAITTFTRRGSRWDRPFATSVARSFHSEARRVARLYAHTSFPGAAPT